MRAAHPQGSWRGQDHIDLTTPSPPCGENALPARPPPPRTPPRSRRWPPSSRGHHWPRRPRAAHAPHGPPRPSPTHHALWGCPGWPGYARVGRWWPAAASPCRRGSRRWWRRWWPRTPPPTTTRTPARATTRPSPCVPRLPRGAPWSLLIAHTRGTPMGARGKSYTHVANPPSPPGAPQRRAATPPPPPTTPQTPPRRHLLAPHAYPEVPWDPFPRPTCVGHAWAGIGKHRDSYGA